MKKVLFLILMFLVSFKASALTYGGCDYSTVARLKSLVNNINISYDYRIVDNEAYFDVTINNITPEMYIRDIINNRVYYYSDTVDGEIKMYGYKDTKVKYNFYSVNCNNISIGKKYYNFPTYNKYYGDPICEGIQDYKLCKKWANVNYTYDEMKEYINEYKSKSYENDNNNIDYEKSVIDKVVDFYVKYYFYILPSIIVVFGLIIVINRKKNRFNL